MAESEQHEIWRSLIDIFYDTETLEVRPGCDEHFDDMLSMKIAICARLANIGHEKDALRLWNHITAEQSSSQSSDPCGFDDRATGEADGGIDTSRAHVNQTDVNIRPVAFSPVDANCINRNHISNQKGGQGAFERPANGAAAEEES